MVWDAQLLADSRGIHQAFRATGPFPTHQPQGETFHLPARLDKQSCG